MSAELEQLAPKTDDDLATDIRTTRPKRRGNTRRRPRNAATAQILVPVLGLASVVVSCGTNETTTQAVLNNGPSHVQNVEDTLADGEAPLKGTDEGPKPSATDVPDVVGLSGDEAFARLEDAGFYVEFDAYDTPRNGVQLDTVTGMEPIAGTRVPFGSTVTLSIFAEPVRVPDVVGLSSDEALAQLEAARFYVIFYAHDTPKTGVQHDTVTSMEPIAGTQVPFGSTVTLSIYTDNSTGDEPVMTEEDWERVRIQGEVNTEFGDRRGPSSWDETTATLNFQIADLSTGDIDRLQSRYADEAFTVTFSNATVSSGELDALKEPTGDLVRDYFDECAAYPSTYGIGVNVVDWAVSVSFSLTEAEGYSIDECINDMKQAVLANAADFAKEHSIDADPADLVIFHESGQMGPEDPP